VRGGLGYADTPAPWSGMRERHYMNGERYSYDRAKRTADGDGGRGEGERGGRWGKRGKGAAGRRNETGASRKKNEAEGKVTQRKGRGEGGRQSRLVKTASSGPFGFQGPGSRLIGSVQQFWLSIGGCDGRQWGWKTLYFLPPRLQFFLSKWMRANQRITPTQQARCT